MRSPSSTLYSLNTIPKPSELKASVIMSTSNDLPESNGSECLYREYTWTLTELQESYIDVYFFLDSISPELANLTFMSVGADERHAHMKLTAGDLVLFDGETFCDLEMFQTGLRTKLALPGNKNLFMHQLNYELLFCLYGGSDANKVMPYKGENILRYEMVNKALQIVDADADIKFH